MDKFEFAECVSQIDEKFIEEAQMREEDQITVRKRKTPWALIAACFCLVVALPILILSLKSGSTQSLDTPSENEVVPSETQLSFYTIHNDEAQGDAKQVSGLQFPAVESQTPEPTLFFEDDIHWVNSPDGTRRYGHHDYYDGEKRRSQICCYEGETLIWESEPLNFEITKLSILDRIIAVSGVYNYIGTHGTEKDYYFQIFDLNGQPLWERTSPMWTDEMGFFEHENGEISVFVINGGYEWNAAGVDLIWNGDLCAYRYSASGERLSECVTKQVQARRILDLERTDDGFVLVLDATYENYMGDCYVVFLNEDGSLREYWQYGNDTDHMRITNALQTDRWLYLSGYLVHNEKYEFLGYETAALSEKLKEQWKESGADGMEEDITEQARAYYTALLLKVDMATGEIVTFYTTPGALGADIYLAPNGAVHWQQENLGKVLVGYMSNVIGTCDLINYRIEDGHFLIEKTQIFTEYSRIIY